MAPWKAYWLTCSKVRLERSTSALCCTAKLRASPAASAICLRSSLAASCTSSLPDACPAACRSKESCLEKFSWTSLFVDV